MRLNPIDNESNIAEGFIDDMRDSFGTRDQQRFIDGVWSDDTTGSLFPAEVIDRYRIEEKHAPENYERRIIAVDPSGCAGAEDTRSDEVGIVMLAMAGGHAYVEKDFSGRYGPIEWGELVVDLYSQHGVDAIVVETNFGAALATATIKAAATNSGVSPRFVEVSASRAKHLRAEPISALFEKGLVHFVGRFSDLEAQLGSFTTAGYQGDRSPDRADAFVHGVSELMPRMLSHSKQSRLASRRRDRPAFANVGYSASKPWVRGPGQGGRWG
jgi:phage terminase large subunit-like protein